MNMKRIVTLVLVLFVAASVVYLVASESRRGEDAGGASDRVERDVANGTGTGGPAGAASQVDESAPDEGVAGSQGEASAGAGNTNLPEHAVIAYYFRGTKRCRKCLAIEAYTKEAIEQGFPTQLESGVLEFRAVNVDERENGHYIGDYELTTKSVILSDRRGGAEERWKNLKLVWEYVGDKEIFIDYVRRETEDYLEELANE
jgi:hypothetical protein